MSGRALDRALRRLASASAVLAPVREGAGFAVFGKGDRRCRPVARVSARDVKQLAAEGVLARPEGSDAYVLSEAGHARVRRGAAPPSEQFQAQHRPVIDRVVADRSGALRPVRGHDAHPSLTRISALRDPRGAPWLSAAEIAAAGRLRADWDRAQIGLVAGSDWSAPPRGASARGPGNAQEAALAARCDAGRRTQEALDALAPSLRRVVERIVLYEDGLEAIERSEGWPQRSAKIALKLGLSQLAQMRG
jgi:hypothetical protein